MLSANPKFACTGERIIQKTPLNWAGGNSTRLFTNPLTASPLAFTASLPISFPELRSPWPAVGKRSGSNHYERTKEITEFWLSGILVPRGRDPFGQHQEIATSGHVQNRKSTIHGLPVTLRMLRAKSAKSDWFWSQSIVFTTPFKTGMSSDKARGRDSWCWPKRERPLGTRMVYPAHCASASMAHAWNGCSQSCRFPTAGHGERSSGNEIASLPKQKHSRTKSRQLRRLCKLWPSNWPTYVEIIGHLKPISLMRQFPDC